MKAKFKEIKQKYDGYYKSLLKKGIPLVRDTQKGIWGQCPADDIFEFFKEIKLDRFKNFLDLGSGDGKIVAIASLFGIKVTGIEFDKILHKDAKRLHRELYLDTHLLQGDYMKHDFRHHDTVFINPDKGFHHGLETKLMRELKGELYVCNIVFQPRFLEKCGTIWVNQTPIVCYHKKHL